ncbi:MAG: diguanylate cyclase [Clostridia bacterium]|nr:diguanylate cyclase [Clostridia bacterium]
MLRCFMSFVFAALFIASLKIDLFAGNEYFYLAALIYSVVAACLFLFLLEKKSISAQLMICLSISLLFFFAVLAKKPRVQKDTDELTGLKNKSALTKAINRYLADETKDKGILLLLDINHFKSVNDTYGHEVRRHIFSKD